MHLAAWPFLLLLLVLPGLWLLHRRAERERAQRLARLLDAPVAGLLLPPDRTVERRRRTLATVAGLAAIVLALAQPQWGVGGRDVALHGRDIVVALDVSLSMLAEDAAPSRLQKAKLAARSLVESLGADSGHRLALVTFAGRPEVRCPPTRDRALFLDRLQSASVDDLPQRGSALGAALIKLLDMLAVPDPAFTDVILISDGEDHGGQAVEGARFLKARGASLHTVGVGDPREGAPIPIAGEGDRRTFLAHQGRPVETRLRAGILTAMAEAAGGTYVAIETGDPSLGELYRRAIAPRPARELETGGGELAPRFQLALALALAILAIEAFGRWRRS